MKTLCPLAKDDPSPHLNVYTVWRKVTVIVCLHYQCLETHLIQFDMAAGSGWGGIHPSVRHAKNKTFPVAIFIMLQETFLYDWSRYTLAPIFGKIGRRETYGLRSRWCCWAILPRPFLNTPEYVHFHHFLTLCQVSELFEHVKASKSPFFCLNNNKNPYNFNRASHLRCSGPNKSFSLSSTLRFWLSSFK